MSAAISTAGRIQWIDSARGIGIVLIVLGHVLRGLDAAGVTGSVVSAFVITALYTFHLQIFIFLSGVNVPRSLRKDTGFLQEKLETIAWPYLIWSMLQGLAMIAVAGKTNTEFGWTSLASIGWHPVGQFWYLYVLFVYMIVAWFVRAWTLLVPLATVVLIASYFLDGETDLHRLLYYFPFFVAGIILSDYVVNHQHRISPIWLIACAVVFAASLGLLQFDLAAPHMAATALPCAIGGSLFVLLTARMLSGRWQQLLSALGQMSLAIFVMHILATGGARIILSAAGLHDPAAHILIGCLAGVLLPIAAYVVLHRLGALPLLGLAKWKPAKQASAVT